MQIKSFVFSILVGSLVAGAAQATPFFKVGTCYLFLPRHDYINKGQVVNVTPQEVVFKNIKVIPSTIISKKVSEAKAIHLKDEAIHSYLESKNRLALEQSSPLGDIPIAFSRAEMGAIKLDRCGK